MAKIEITPAMAMHRYHCNLLLLVRRVFLEYCKKMQTDRIDLRPLNMGLDYGVKDVAWKNGPAKDQYDYMKLYGQRDKRGDGLILYQIGTDDIKTLYHYLKEQMGTATVKIRVQCQKKRWSADTRDIDRYDLVTFYFRADKSKSMHEQSCDAFEEACKRGAEPNKQMRMHWLDGSPIKDADGEDIDVAIDCPNGRKNGSLRA